MSTARHAAGCALLVALSTGCGGGPPPEPPWHHDSGIERVTRSGLAAFGQGRHEVAASQFRRALDLAYEMDDPRAVVDARYNLAAALMELEREDEALPLLEAAVAESEREGLPVTADLWLLRAAAEFRRGDYAAARAAAERALDLATPGGALAARSHFLLGLLAARREDGAALAAALAALPAASADPRLAADRAELAGHVAALSGDPATAVARLGEAAAGRSRTGAYRAAARALAEAGRIAESAGLHTDAARHFLRAGRSAAARGARAQARDWLQEARRNAAAADDAAMVREADSALASLDA